ncbi:hypothetical protein CBR_g30341 [Chara braunii]|uniref:Inositol-1-monophosphatase n=1 Tax=Chara braunii TaxID=69332 RepID=A0A388JX87_CHABU|nr:hypothetical protein CBR_g30341 [Chara braunii]|eukprot:GBG62387.1 hypothetical protein CBR_g30341 [Chara braunii]
MASCSAGIRSLGIRGLSCHGAATVARTVSPEFRPLLTSAHCGGLAATLQLGGREGEDVSVPPFGAGAGRLHAARAGQGVLERQHQMPRMGGSMCKAMASFSGAAASYDVQVTGAAKKIGAVNQGSVPADELLKCAEMAARKGAEVVMEAIDKPRNIAYKGGSTDLVTDTDKKCEDAIVGVLRETFPDHLLLGEEGGVEFSGGPFCWVTRTFTATSGGGAFCNGKSISASDTDMVEKSLLVTGFGYEHDEAWLTNLDLFKHFTDVSRGVRRLGAASVDMCHVALGIVEGYWEYRLKPWDMAAGALIVEEAGGTVTRMDGGDFTVFDRSVLVSNTKIHSQLLDQTGPATTKLISAGFDFSQWFKPEEYQTDE